MIRVEIDNYQPSQALLERHAAVMDLYWDAFTRKPVEQKITQKTLVKTAGKLAIGDIVDMMPINGENSLGVITAITQEGYNVTITTLCEVSATVDIGLLCKVEDYS